MNALIQLDNAKRILAEVKTFDEVKVLRDKASAIQSYLKQQGDCLELQQDAAEIKLRAERRLGELLAETVEHGGGRKASLSNTMLPEGITKMQSHRWQLIASLPVETFETYLGAAKERRIEITTAAALKLAKRQPGKTRDEERDARCIEDLECLISQGRKYGTIYADPPWHYGNQVTRSATDTKYQTMSIEEICALPVNKLSADNCHLHLWTTNGFLFEAKEVMEAWGFEYKSCFVWVKDQMGIGNYWRVSHEFLLLGVKGNLTFADHGLNSWEMFPRTKHSAKPLEVRKLVAKASPAPRLELFGRQLADGWDVWGNEVEITMFDNELFKESA